MQANLLPLLNLQTENDESRLRDMLATGCLPLRFLLPPCPLSVPCSVLTAFATLPNLRILQFLYLPFICLRLFRLLPFEISSDLGLGYLY